MFLLLLLGGAMLSSQAADAANPIYISVDGKSTVATGETNPYEIMAIGGPAEGTGGNYTFTVTLEGKNIDDALLYPNDGSSATGIFKFNLTAPTVSTEMTIIVDVTSTSSTGSKQTSSRNYYVDSVAPIVISAKVINQGSVALTGIPVYFYADGELLEEKSVSLAAGASTFVYYNWTENVGQGQHEVTVELDPNNQFVRFASGGTVYTQTIYVGMSDYGNTNAILIGGIVLLAFVAYIVYRRPAKRRKK
jgi:hypothetical protein